MLSLAQPCSGKLHRDHHLVRLSISKLRRGHQIVPWFCPSRCQASHCVGDGWQLARQMLTSTQFSQFALLLVASFPCRQRPAAVRDACVRPHHAQRQAIGIMILCNSEPSLRWVVGPRACFRSSQTCHDGGLAEDDP